MNNATLLPFSHGAEARLTLVLEGGKDESLSAPGLQVIVVRS